MARYPANKAVALAGELLLINRIAARAAARTLARRARQGPRLAGWSLAYEGIVELMTLGTPATEIHDPDQIRAPLDGMTVLSRALQREHIPVALSHVRGEWVGGAGSGAPRVILYLHGGGYVSGSPATHRPVTARLAREAEARVFALDYRLAPEHPFPAAVVDAWSAYWWLLGQGIAPEQIVVAGDSAGGGLSLALLLALRDAGLPMPAGAVGLSPWFDLALTATSLRTNNGLDFLNPAVLQASATMYLGNHDVHEPLASPLYADLHGLPPLLIQCGSAEMLLDDSRRLVERARAAGVDARLEIWDGMVHVWHFAWRIEPKARAALQGVGRFVRARIPSAGRVEPRESKA